MPGRARLVVVLAGLVAALLAVAVLSVAVGARVLPLAEVWAAVARPATADADAAGVVRGLRLPRTALGLLAGAALGAAGALTRGHTRNPLADPSLLGVGSGAALAVVVATYVFGVSGPLPLMLAGLVGAAAGSVVVFALAWRSAPGESVTLVVAGTGVSAALTAVTSALVLSDGASLETWRVWNVGSPAGRDPAEAWVLLPFVVVGLVVAAWNAPRLTLLELGDDAAAALGVPVARTRIAGFLGISVLVGAATAACGPIAFLGLVCTQLARLVVGVDYRRVLPVAALLGAVVLPAADVVGRIVVRPGELQASVVLALLGAPLFVAAVFVSGSGRAAR